MNENESGVDERIVEMQMAYYYQYMDTEDLAGSISDPAANGYLLLYDLGLRAILSLYCAKVKDFDQFVFLNERAWIQQVFCAQGI